MKEDVKKALEKVAPGEWTPKRALWLWFILSALVWVILSIQFLFDNKHQIEVNDQENQQEVIKILLEQNLNQQTDKNEQNANFDKIYNLVLDVDKWLRDLEKKVGENSDAIESNQNAIQDILSKLQK